MTIQELRGAIQSSAGGRYLLGSEDLIDLLLIAWLARGHVLIEGPPGTGKTLSAKVLSKLLARTFKRIQFTSDLSPAEITGSHIYQPNSQSFRFMPGPLFADCILADEINRTPPRTQSALLEAMEERQVTCEGQRFELSPDFFVMATQNPQDFEGTFPLPEAQTDRFLLQYTVSHGAAEVDTQIMRATIDGRLNPNLIELEPLEVDRDRLDREIQGIKVDDSVLDYIARILGLTRRDPMLATGSSVRGGLALAKTSRIVAAIGGRDFVVPDDIKFLAVPVLRHRIRLTPEAQMSGENEVKIISDILKKAEFPA